jgi:hypothetical protein
MTQVTWQVVVAMLLVIVTVIALLIRATSKNFDPLSPENSDGADVQMLGDEVAEQRAKTATAEAKANEILAASVTNDPNVLVSKCLDAAREAHISPLGCWPNTTAVPTVPAR